MPLPTCYTLAVGRVFVLSIVLFLVLGEVFFGRIGTGCGTGTRRIPGRATGAVVLLLDARCSIVGCMHMYLCEFTFCLVAPSFLLFLPSSPLLVACVGHHSCLVRARFLHIILCLPSPSTSLHFAPLFFPVTRPRPLSSSFARAFSPDSDSDPDLDSDLPSALPTPDRALA